MICPEPVVATKRALEAVGDEPLEVLVDEGAPRENVARFILNRGYRLEERKLEEGYALVACKRGESVQHHKKDESSTKGKIIFITSDRLGDGNEELGRLLMKNFIITLLDLPTSPESMIFFNSGINLTTNGSEVIKPLSELVNRGVEILSCGLCLDYFHKKDQLLVGSVTNMFTSSEKLLQADSIIKL